MGYGFGVFLIALGLILALAVADRAPWLDLTLIGWIVAGAGVLLVVLTGITQARGSSFRRTTHPDGSETVSRREPPPV